MKTFSINLLTKYLNIRLLLQSFGREVRPFGYILALQVLKDSARHQVVYDNKVDRDQNDIDLWY